MKEEAVALRYARALFGLAREGDFIFKVGQELETIAEFLNGQGRLKDILSHPAIDCQAKAQLVQDVLGHLGACPLTERFIILLVANERLNLLETIAKIYNEEFAQLDRKQKVEVQTALPLNQLQEESLRSRLSKKLSRDVEFKVSLRPELIAGLRVKIGDQVYDASLAGRLKLMRKVLVEE
jgi:F-type H+-transporting ATPase subunit delta